MRLRMRKPTNPSFLVRQSHLLILAPAMLLPLSGIATVNANAQEKLAPVSRSALPAAAVSETQPTEDATESGFVDLFDGKSLEGWHGSPHLAPGKYEEADAAQKEKWEAETIAHWSVEEAELINDGDGPYLTTDKSYGNYELLIDYKTVARADSGIYLRGVPQVQIWDYTDESKFGIGSDKGSESRISVPFSSTLILDPSTVTSWKFHSPTGRRNPRVAAAMP